MRNLVLPILISYKDHSKTMCNGTTDLKLQNVFFIHTQAYIDKFIYTDYRTQHEYTVQNP